MISLGGLILGLLNIALIVAILLLIGAIIVWGLSFFQLTVPWNVQRLYIAIVVLIALYELVALLFGLPAIRVIDGYR